MREIIDQIDVRIDAKIKSMRNADAGLAVVHLPISLRVKADLQEAVLGIVPLAAAGANQIAAPRGSLAIVVLGHGERGSATARDQEHAQRRLRSCRGFAGILHDSAS